MPLLLFTEAYWHNPSANLYTLSFGKKYHVTAPENSDYHPTYKVLTHSELLQYFNSREVLRNAGCMITELGDKFMLIKWERFRKNSL